MLLLLMYVVLYLMCNVNIHTNISINLTINNRRLRKIAITYKMLRQYGGSKSNNYLNQRECDTPVMSKYSRIYVKQKKGLRRVISVVKV